tara:strand:+ start:956 stop:1282 length:327 start_codon:yes stop_codon:yes gene_type:complete
MLIVKTLLDITIEIYTSTVVQISMNNYFAYINSFLTEETRAFGRRRLLFRRLQLKARGRMPQSLAEHVEIVEAQETGDINKADEISREHLMFSTQRFCELRLHMECGP